jgi:helicase SWR1
MEEVRSADADIESVPQPASPHAAQHEAAVDEDGAPAAAIKDEEGPTGENGVEDVHGGGGVMQRPVKRRKLEDNTPTRSASRAVSPPWRPFAVDGPTTVFENGVRKSSRVNRDAAPPTPEPVKRNSRQTNHAAQTNGTPKSSIRKGTRTASGPAPAPASTAKSKTAPSSKKKASAPSLPPSQVGAPAENVVCLGRAHVAIVA